MIRFWLLISLISFSSGLFAKTVTFATLNAYWLYDNTAPHKDWWDKQRGKRGQTYEQALTLVAKAIKKTNADVIGLQEIESLSVVKDLNKKLKKINAGYKYVWISKTGDEFTGQNVALLSQYPQVKGTEVVNEYSKEEEYFLTEKDRGNEDVANLSKALRVDLNINNKNLSVFVFHLKSQYGGSVADQKRLAQSSIVRRITQPLLSKNQSVVLMGDLNADRGSPSLLRIRGFDDIFTGLYQSTQSRDFKGDRWTYKYRGRPTQLDHILLSNDLKHKISSGHINYDHDYLTSDHYPVILILDL